MALYRYVVTTSHAALGGTGTNTWHIRTLDDPLAVGSATILSGYINALYEGQASAFSDGATINFNGELVGVGPDEGEANTIDPWTVTSLGSIRTLPPANCVCISWEGQSGDRSKRGRTFFGPIGEAQSEADGTLSNTALAAWRESADDLVASSTGFDDGAVGIWSRQESVFRDVVASHVTDQFAVLRSRRD